MKTIDKWKLKILRDDIVGNNVMHTMTTRNVELAWRSGSVMDCHATARGSIPGRNGVETEGHVLRKGQ